jgi:transposase-like protein
MKTDTTKPACDVADEKLFDNWFDPVEAGPRAKARGFIETMIEEELDTALSRPRHGRRPGLAAAGDAAAPVAGHRHGHRTRTLTGTFGPAQIAVPRARIIGEDGKTAEWKSKSPRAYRRRAKQAEAPIAGAYLSGTNTRRARRALSAVFKGAVGKKAPWARMWLAGPGAR